MTVWFKLHCEVWHWSLKDGFRITLKKGIITAYAVFPPVAYHHSLRQVKWLRGNSQPETRADGAIVWYGIVIDITEHQQAAADTQLREALNQTILEAIPDLIFPMHRDGTYHDVKLTDAFRVIIGTEDVGKNMADLLPESVLSQRMDAIAKVLDSGPLPTNLPMQKACPTG